MLKALESVHHSTIMSSYDLFALDTDQLRAKLGHNLRTDICELLFNPKACDYEQIYRHCTQLVSCTWRLATDPVEAILASALQRGAFALLMKHNGPPQDCRMRFESHAAHLNGCLLYWLQMKNHSGIRDIISEFSEVAWSLAMKEVRDHRQAAMLEGLTKQITSMTL